MAKITSSFFSCVTFILMSIGVTTSAHADYTYTYTGNQFSLGYNYATNTYFTPNVNDYLTFSITTQNMLIPNSTYSSLSIPTGLKTNYPTIFNITAADGISSISINHGSYFVFNSSALIGSNGLPVNENITLEGAQPSTGNLAIYSINSTSNSSLSMWSYALNSFSPGTWSLKQVPHVAGESPIPEPQSYAMMLAGLGLIGFTLRRRRELVV
jgi:hypothetical protein